MREKNVLGSPKVAFKLSALLLLAAGITVADTLTDLQIAMGVFHIAVVLLAMSFLPSRGVTAIALMCMGLTVVSYRFTSSGDTEAGLINCLISLAAIASTTWLVLRMSSAISAVHEARANLAHIARVNVLGELTTSIAHEVNQPLAAIVTSGNASLRWMAAEPPNLEKAGSAVERIISDANRASQVIARVRGLAKREQPAKEWLNVSDTITEILALVRSEMAQRSVTLTLEIADGLPPVLADRVQIQQVLLNLIVNAMEALRGIDDDTRRELEIRAIHDPRGQLVVSVSDSGIGLSGQDHGRLFDAFYTSKTEGMGIGLTISRSIIEAHGGSISATPNPLHGVTLQFSLPTSKRDSP